MPVSPPPAPSSIDVYGLPPRVIEAAARVFALCREELRSEPRPEAPEEVELRVREATNEFARDVMGAVIEKRDDGASRIERDGAELVPGRRRTGCADLPCPDQIRPLRAGMEGHHRRNRHTGQRQHQSTCSSHGNRCLNSMNQAEAITAIRDSHPVPRPSDSWRLPR